MNNKAITATPYVCNFKSQLRVFLLVNYFGQGLNIALYTKSLCPKPQRPDTKLGHRRGRADGAVVRAPASHQFGLDTVS